MMLLLAPLLSYLTGAYSTPDHSSQCTDPIRFDAKELRFVTDICESKLCEYQSIENGDEKDLYVRDDSYCGGKVCAVSIDSLAMYEDCTCESVQSSENNNEDTDTGLDTGLDTGTDTTINWKRHTVKRLGVTGLLSRRECGALAFMAQWAQQRAKDRADANKTLTGSKNSCTGEIFTYVEAGSFMGLSMHVVMSTLRSKHIAAQGYSHDLFSNVKDGCSFDSDKHHHEKDIAQLQAHESFVHETLHLNTLRSTVSDTKLSHIEQYYEHIIRNNFLGTVFPIPGPSSVTMAMHEPNSVDLIFIDGDHTKKGCYADLQTGWSILRSGAVLIGHDYDFSPGGIGVVLAVNAFSKEQNVPLYLIQGTSIFLMTKP